MKMYLPDLLNSTEPLDLLIVGMHPGRDSCRAGHYFARPAHRIWTTLFQAGLTSERLCSNRDYELLKQGIGVTDLSKNTAHGDLPDVGRIEVAALLQKVARHKPKAVAFLGSQPATEFARVVGDRPMVEELSQRRWGRIKSATVDTAIFVVPDPSTRNAHFNRLYPNWCDLSRHLGRQPRAASFFSE